MMFFVLKDQSDDDNGQSWHTGDIVPKIDPNTLDYIQADGHELNHIIANFPNLPFARRDVVKFTGEFARFIYVNL
jgi:hypothetical protein